VFSQPGRLPEWPEARGHETSLSFLDHGLNRQGSLNGLDDLITG